MLVVASHHLDYPEDIRLFGASFSTTFAHRHGVDRGNRAAGRMPRCS